MIFSFFAQYTLSAVITFLPVYIAKQHFAHLITKFYGIPMKLINNILSLLR